MRKAFHLPPGRGRAAVTFILRFLAGWLISVFILSAFPSIEDWAIRDTVRSLRFVLGASAPNPGASQRILRVGGEYWEIVPGCTPLMPTITLSVAIAAFPSAPRWKLLGMVVGGVLLWVFNIGRLVVLFLVETWIPAAASLVHVYFFQTLAFLFVCIIFMFWLDIQMRRRAP